MKKVTLFLSAFIICSLYVRAQDSLQQYVAKYKFPQGSVVQEINVVMENGTLSLNSSMGTAAIEKIAVDTFAISSYNGTAVFTRNEAKKISGIKIEVMGINLEGVKESKETISGGAVQPVLPVNTSTFPMRYLPSMLTGDDEE
jgi:hypothetical protein